MNHIIDTSPSLTKYKVHLQSLHKAEYNTQLAGDYSDYSTYNMKNNKALVADIVPQNLHRAQNDILQILHLQSSHMTNYNNKHLSIIFSIIFYNSPFRKQHNGMQTVLTTSEITVDRRRNFGLKSGGTNSQGE